MSSDEERLAIVKQHRKQEVELLSQVCGYCKTRWLVDSIEKHERVCAMRIACPRCKAAPLHKCRYPNGAVRPACHAIRTHPAKEAPRDE